uniref:Uncharacterized protein n=2 Tax=Rhizophagus irregularis TaxID=588596 RepID=U9SN46_RHIID
MLFRYQASIALFVEGNKYTNVKLEYYHNQRLQLPMGKLCVGMHCLNEKSENHVPCANKMYLEKAVAKIRSIHHINRNDRK